MAYLEFCSSIDTWFALYSRHTICIKTYRLSVLKTSCDPITLIMGCFPMLRLWYRFCLLDLFSCLFSGSLPCFSQQPFVDADDPDKEKRIKELELLLMSAEHEVRRKRLSSVRLPCALLFLFFSCMLLFLPSFQGLNMFYTELSAWWWWWYWWLSELS